MSDRVHSPSPWRSWGTWAPGYASVAPRGAAGPEQDADGVVIQVGDGNVRPAVAIVVADRQPARSGANAIGHGCAQRAVAVALEHAYFATPGRAAGGGDVEFAVAIEILDRDRQDVRPSGVRDRRPRLLGFRRPV